MNTALKAGLVTLGTATFVASTIHFLRKKPEADAAGPTTDGAPPASDKVPNGRPTDQARAPLTDDVEWTSVRALPTADEVKGDLEANWGTTPVDLRPYFLYLEEQAGIPGAARILSVVSYGEARWITTAHNGDGDRDRDAVERAGSRRAYDRYKAKRPSLRFGEAAADFGSGGLFGALAPFFLWTGINETGARAPLLNADPRTVFLPRVAGFAACVYLMRLLRYYPIDDVFDIKVGWASPSLLVGERRTSEKTTAIRSKFSEQASTVGIDLWDSETVPAVLTVEAFPGVLELFATIVGELPTPAERSS